VHYDLNAKIKNQIIIWLPIIIEKKTDLGTFKLIIDVSILEIS